MKISSFGMQNHNFKGKVILNLNSIAYTLADKEKNYGEATCDTFVREVKTLKNRLEKGTPHDATYKVALSCHDEDMTILCSKNEIPYNKKIGSMHFIDVNVDKVESYNDKAEITVRSFQKAIPIKEIRRGKPISCKSGKIMVSKAFKELSDEIIKTSKNKEAVIEDNETYYNAKLGTIGNILDRFI